MLRRGKNLTDGEEKEGQSCLKRAHLLWQLSSLSMDGPHGWTECVGAGLYTFLFRNFETKMMFFIFITKCHGMS